MIFFLSPAVGLIPSLMKENDCRLEHWRHSIPTFFPLLLNLGTMSSSG